MKKVLIGAMAALACLAAAPAAQAAPSTPAPYKLVDQCAGNMVPGFPKVLSNQLGDTQGRLELRYSSAAGGTNCVQLYDMAPGKHSMTVTIKREGLSYQGSDSGVYDLYAGGVAVTGTNGKCVWVSGSLVMGSHSVDRFRGSWGPVACG
ncbi:hypothetical protein FKR81_19530 [Lentzea tibetensis]|uniref:Spore-associated protein A n=1 Tax=Lentzea tibetensis TaxID=2591470 RepID=A0A563ET14_9PSEU|nr:hypothetical protein [Lentzea tibetensis]TWP50793.1 hypothetical protein FKR81_19530 [Lentzea tibetensis]